MVDATYAAYLLERAGDSDTLATHYANNRGWRAADCGAALVGLVAALAVGAHPVLVALWLVLFVAYAYGVAEDTERVIRYRTRAASYRRRAALR